MTSLQSDTSQISNDEYYTCSGSSSPSISPSKSCPDPENLSFAESQVEDPIYIIDSDNEGEGISDMADADTEDEEFEFPFKGNQIEDEGEGISDMADADTEDEEFEFPFKEIQNEDVKCLNNDNGRKTISDAADAETKNDELEFPFQKFDVNYNNVPNGLTPIIALSSNNNVCVDDTEFEMLSSISTSTTPSSSSEVNENIPEVQHCIEVETTELIETQSTVTFTTLGDVVQIKNNMASDNIGVESSTIDHSKLLVSPEIDSKNVISETDALNETSKVLDDYADKTVNGVVTITGQHIMSRILETYQPIDAIITLADGRLGAHRMVLAAASPFLEALLIDQNAKKRATLILPDIKKKAMEHLLMFIYTGSVVYPQSDEEDFFNALKTLFVGLNFDMSLFVMVQPKLPRPPTPKILESSSSSTAQNDIETQIPGTSRQKKVDDSTSHNQVRNSIHDDNDTQGVVSFEELQVLTFCPGCNKQWKTVEKCQACLSSHNLTRCWNCLEVFDKKFVRAHYMTNHCDESSIEDSYNTFIRCRWCPRRMNVKNSVSSLGPHSVTHIPQIQAPKRRGRRSSASMDSQDLVIEKTVEGKPIFLKFKTLKGKDTQEMEIRSRPNPIPSPKKHPEPQKLDSEKKVQVNLKKLSMININLFHMPQNIEDKIFRRPPPPMKMNSTSTSKSAETELKQTPTTPDYANVTPLLSSIEEKRSSPIKSNSTSKSVEPELKTTKTRTTHTQDDANVTPLLSSIEEKRSSPIKSNSTSKSVEPELKTTKTRATPDPDDANVTPLLSSKHEEKRPSSTKRDSTLKTAETELKKTRATDDATPLLSSRHKKRKGKKRKLEAGDSAPVDFLIEKMARFELLS